jgi:hypothetical protein
MTMTGTTPGATPFITGTTSTEVAAKVRAVNTGAAKLGAAKLMATVAKLVTTPTKRLGRPTKTTAGAAGIPTVPAQRPGLSTETRMLLEDTVNPAARAAPARAPSAATNMAETPGAFRHAEARALVAEGRMAAVAIGNPIKTQFLVVLVARKI